MAPIRIAPSRGSIAWIIDARLVPGLGCRSRIMAPLDWLGMILWIAFRPSLL